MQRLGTRIAFVVLCAAVLASNAGATNPPHSYVPVDGFVPDEATAIRVAEAIWIPIYGAAAITAEQPIKATLKDGDWFVEGTCHSEKGGVAVAEISKKDGRVLRVSHGK